MMESLDALASRVRTADIVDAMGRLHQHRCHLLDLVSPTPGRRLFGPAVTISYFPTCGAALPPERYNFKRLFYQAIEGGGVAFSANFGVMTDGFLFVWNSMRIMTSLARQRIPAADKASGLPKPVCGTADDFKFVIVSGAWRVIEREPESFQRLTGHE